MVKREDLFKQAWASAFVFQCLDHLDLADLEFLQIPLSILDCNNEEIGLLSPTFKNSIYVNNKSNKHGNKHHRHRHHRHRRRHPHHRAGKFRHLKDFVEFNRFLRVSKMQKWFEE